MYQNLQDPLKKVLDQNRGSLVGLLLLERHQDLLRRQQRQSHGLLVDLPRLEQQPDLLHQQPPLQKLYPSFDQQIYIDEWRKKEKKSDSQWNLAGLAWIRY